MFYYESEFPVQPQLNFFAIQAKRIQNLFDDMKSANSDLPSAPKTQPPALKAEFDSKTIKQSAEEVAEMIFAALKNNNSPAPNHGLKVTVLSLLAKDSFMSRRNHGMIWGRCR
jgi:hypothetical protein